MLQTASWLLPELPLFLMTAVATHLVMSFAQTLMHYKLGHHPMGGKFFRNHINFHHTYYSKDHLLSRTYLGDEGNNTPFFFIPVFLVGACTYLLLPIDLFVVQVVACAASFYAHVFFDKEYHVEGSRLQRFAWFRRKQELHFVHHRHANSNFAVIHFFWDRILGTYRRPAGQTQTNGTLRIGCRFRKLNPLFGVFSVTALCEQLFPGKGTQLAQTWRVKQLQYSLMRSLMGRHRDFWGLTEDGLVWASKSLKVDLTADNKKQLMDAYLALAAFPDVKPGLQALKQQGLKLAILSNGEPKMLEAAAKSAGIRDLLDEIISVEEVNFKTSNRVYWLGTERLKVSNQELGFVSANNWDGVAAVSAGLRTFWIQRTAAEVPEELGFQVDTTVKAITDLPALLRG